MEHVTCRMEARREWNAKRLGLAWRPCLNRAEEASEDTCFHAFSCMHFHSAIKYEVLDPRDVKQTLQNMRTVCLSVWVSSMLIYFIYFIVYL